jgi:hypothetical protein
MSTPFPLSRIAEFDQRSRRFAFAAPAGTGPVTSRPPVVAHRIFGQRLDQGQTGLCTGGALVTARNTHPNHVGGERAFDITMARKVYALATRLDEVPGHWNEDGSGTDTGSSGLAACKAGVQLGLITRYEWCFGVDHLLDALPSHPVIVGTDWTEGMFSPDSFGRISPTGPTQGGHEWTIRGYHLGHRLFYGVNTWGLAWSLRGLFTISFDDMATLLSRDGDVKVPIR